MASDLQDPPETIPSLVSEWRAGNHVVWAVRTRREGEARSTLAFAQLYYWIMRRFAGLTSMPAMGADREDLEQKPPQYTITRTPHLPISWLLDMSW